jgi:low affinity Fe/Cu permease
MASKARAKFRVFSENVAEIAGSPVAFGCAIAMFVVWLVTGPYFGWSDTHHKVLDMIVALTPFWMVFVLQATQNRDSDIVEAKLDELLKAISDAREDLIGIQRHPEKEVDGIR